MTLSFGPTNINDTSEVPVSSAKISVCASLFKGAVQIASISLSDANWIARSK